MKISRKRFGFFGIIVRNFIIFTVIVLTVLIGVCLIGITVVLSHFSNDYSVPIKDNKELFVKGNYDSFQRERLLGEDGYFAVFDENNNVIYRSKGAEYFNLSKEQVDLIPNTEVGLTISINEYVGQDNNKYINVAYETVDNDDNTIKSNTIADSDFNILFSDVPNIEKKLSEFDFNLLTGRYQNEFNISKLSYTGNSGKIYNVVFCRNITDSKSSMKIIKYIGYGYIIFFIVAVLLFVISLNKKVKEPLLLLSNAIESIAKGKTDKTIEYKGPREFEEICHNFNDMALKLHETEKKRVGAEQEKQKMLADISHDLKTPITVIQGYAKAVVDKKVNDNERSDYLNTIYKKSNSLAELINTFSEYSKLERPDFKIETVKTNICEFSRNYLIDKYNELVFFGFELDIQIPDEGIFCMLDVFQIKRVFENIISNTVKYNEKGTIISFVLEKQEDNCIIRIGDNGVGITDELKKIIFNPFSMGDSSRSELKGSGLGMAIVKKIVTAHRGTIELLQEKLEGLSVVYEITFPLTEKE
ncbi:HAMP domain-containing sensor histidine kinase [Oceanirhabdus seepicola]|uniref:histidine kinase n=1 Tax=Oceanirhabdus seepicola TaxID=2828781 RepID=A0A9J6NXW9_9CLOT|nr:HAMP domain-containing sensor histidine kinase [Oceanirhabdus seepicola]MCM1988745.1 HAMP domain-containing histidine kinase [Oceanirhabdus seepicola]